MEKFSIKDYKEKINQERIQELDAFALPVYNAFVKYYEENNHEAVLTNALLEAFSSNAKEVDIALNSKTIADLENSWKESKIELPNIGEKEILPRVGEAYDRSTYLKKVTKIDPWSRELSWSYSLFLLYQLKERILPKLDCQIEAYKKDYCFAEELTGFTLDWSEKALQSMKLNWKCYLPFVKFDDVNYLDGRDCAINITVCSVILLVAWGIFFLICFAITKSGSMSSLLALFISFGGFGGVWASYFNQQYQEFQKEINKWKE